MIGSLQLSYPRLTVVWRQVLAAPLEIAEAASVFFRYVFNIGGNKYRLIAGLSFQAQRLWVKAILTHADYDKGAWK